MLNGSLWGKCWLLEGGAAVIFYKSAHRHKKNCVYYIVLTSKNSFFPNYLISLSAYQNI